MEFAGKTAVVTGAASGIGRSTALGFGNAGAKVALFDLDADGAHKVADEIARSGAQAMVCQVDVANPSKVREALDAVRARFDSLDALANVAAIYPRAPVLEITEDFWDQTLSINLRGAFFCCQEAIRIMVAQGSGAIVNVASGAAFRAIEGLAAYAASKAGLVGMTRVLALEFARKGVRANVVAPGHTGSDTYLASVPAARVDAIAASLVPGRFMDPEESANAIIWLCSDAASGVNGAIIIVNGGNYMP
jgi:NAD(P)-dependent dehydrogenase (short-subunit alcohol dehydrogenase family)